MKNPIMSYDIYEFLNKLVREGIIDLTNHNAYFGAGAIAGGIEFLGACLDEHAFDVERQSAARFCLALNELFPSKYRPFSRQHPFAKENKPEHDLYTSLRCGMAHVCRPQGVFLTGSIKEANRDGNSHLEILELGKKQGPLIVVEQFAQDFDKAIEKLIDRLQRGDDLPPKLSGNILEVWNS